ncbi:coiled-coil domain-containing protein [Borreliella burgdorferi]|uniref:coiled-coil domain-containing protein n=1 Tax=Borreliella burgdorferi TaxID=139 RepID=UPI000D02D9B6|nr:hypothetical protein [Borreliella burgdorferi]PRR16369.1 hypothetical protein CV649_01050 [Borreliella burgdorferi]PRR20011.1 hypothetical protein CV647_01050 [Borreliella burgdorferi]PRR24033.1 hypothetical protein CV646_03240 [Borreliella burgdorferi]PRR54888.1 hypothetical protein CV650_01050 [Borreliella burgdorferi]PRR55701.1 hypothetical protein CV653_01050 [Borreliella burgdorferi]
MMKKIKSEINLLKIEKDKNLIELGKILKNNNIVELKNLNHYPNLKLVEKELYQMKSNLSKSEENENILKNLNKKIYILKKEYKSTSKSYKKNLKEIAKTIIEIYPQNLELISKYNMNFSKLKLEKYKKIELASDHKTKNYLQKIMLEVSSTINNIINMINVYKISKEFEKQVFTKYYPSENFESIMNEFSLNKKLNNVIVKEFKIINEIKTNLKNIKEEIKEIISTSKKEKIYKKNTIKNEINVITKNKENILKKIAEEFIEITKKDKMTAKTNAISSIIQKIEKINQKILNLNNDLIKITKQEEIKNIQQKIQALTKEKNKINNKLDALTSKIEVIQNELDNE